MRRIHQRWKVLVVGFMIGVHLLSGLLARLLPAGPRRRAFHLANLARHSRIMLAILGVEVRLEGEEHWPKDRTFLVVSNHMGYLDMLAFASVRTVCFVSTMEVLATPLLGKVAEASGSLFVERRSRENIRQEIADISGVLQNGFSMVFFPEGTSTNGEQVLPFKRPLFAPAERTGTAVLPVAVQYTEVDGAPVTRANRDLLCWYGDMDFYPHLLALAGCQGAQITLRALPPIEMDGKISREEIASRAQAAVSGSYKPIS